jgi:hypothetical protein
MHGRSILACGTFVRLLEVRVSSRGVQSDGPWGKSIPHHKWRCVEWIRSGKKDIQGAQLTAECCANSQPAYSKQGDLLVSHLSLVFNLPSLIPFLSHSFPSPLCRAKSREWGAGLSKTYVQRSPMPTTDFAVNDSAPNIENVVILHFGGGTCRDDGIAICWIPSSGYVLAPSSRRAIETMCLVSKRPNFIRRTGVELEMCGIVVSARWLFALGAAAILSNSDVSTNTTLQALCSAPLLARDSGVCAW